VTRPFVSDRALESKVKLKGYDSCVSLYVEQVHTCDDHIVNSIGVQMGLSKFELDDRRRRPFMTD